MLLADRSAPEQPNRGNQRKPPRWRPSTRPTITDQSDEDPNRGVRSQAADIQPPSKPMSQKLLLSPYPSSYEPRTHFSSQRNTSPQSLVIDIRNHAPGAAHVTNSFWLHSRKRTGSEDRPPPSSLLDHGIPASIRCVDLPRFGPTPFVIGAECRRGAGRVVF